MNADRKQIIDGLKAVAIGQLDKEKRIFCEGIIDFIETLPEPEIKLGGSIYQNVQFYQWLNFKAQCYKNKFLIHAFNVVEELMEHFNEFASGERQGGNVFLKFGDEITADMPNGVNELKIVATAETEKDKEIKNLRAALNHIYTAADDSYISDLALKALDRK